MRYLQRGSDGGLQPKPPNTVSVYFMELVPLTAWSVEASAAGATTRKRASVEPPSHVRMPIRRTPCRVAHVEAGQVSPTANAGSTDQVTWRHQGASLPRSS